MAEIWEERYDDEKYGLEHDASWRIFNRMLSEFDRSHITVARKLILEDIAREKECFMRDPNTNNDDYKPPSEEEINERVESKRKTIQRYSSKWHYKERLLAYDLHITQMHREQKEQMVLDWEKEQLKIALSRPFIHHETLRQIHEAPEDEMPISKRAYSEETNERAYYNSLQAVYSLLHSGVKVIEENQTQQININKEAKIISDTIYDVVDEALGLKTNKKNDKKLVDNNKDK